MNSVPSLALFLPVILVFAIGCSKNAANGPIETGSAETAAAFAEGFDKGNGGDAVVCFNYLSSRDKVKKTLIDNRDSLHPTNPFSDPSVVSDIRSIELLDLYEYRLPTGFPPVQKNVIDVKQSFQVELERVLSRLEKKSELGTTLRESLSYISLNNWQATPGIIEIDDSEESIILPSECLLVQLAARRDNRVFYDQVLFSQLDELNKLALVIHEITYKVAVDLGQKDSHRARQAVGLILSQDEFNAMSPLELHKALTHFGEFAFPYEVKGQTVWLKSVSEYWQDGGIRAAGVFKSTPFELGDQKFVLQPYESGKEKASIGLDPLGEVQLLHGYLAADGYGRTLNATFTFDPQARINHLYGDQCGKFSWLGKDFGMICAAYFANGQLTSLDATNAQFHTSFGDVLNAQGAIELHPGTLNVKRANVPTRLRAPNGYIVSKGAIELDENGNVIRIEQAFTPTFQCTSTSCNFSLDEKTRIYLKNALVEFYPNGDFKRVEFREPPSGNERLEVTSGNFGFQDTAAVEFYPGNRLKKVLLNGAGIVVMTDSNGHREQHQVGAVTIDFDESGKLNAPLP